MVAVMAAVTVAANQKKMRRSYERRIFIFN
jgi:hypothetical protein